MEVKKDMGLFEWLEGKKTYIGGICAILVGLGKAGYDWYMGKFATDPFEEYGAWLILGWTIIGGRSAFGNKIT